MLWGNGGRDCSVVKPWTEDQNVCTIGIELSGIELSVQDGLEDSLAMGVPTVCDASDRERPTPSEGVRSRRTDHARSRQAEGRPIGTAFQDAQGARQVDVFVQPDGRYVVRGSRGREHVFDTDGVHITTLRRSQSAHETKLTRGERQPITREAWTRFQEFFK